MKDIAQGLYLLQDGNLNAQNPIGQQPALNLGFVEGMHIKAHWADVEQSEGNFTWQYIDAAVALVQQKVKKCGLSIGAGIGAPVGWLTTAGCQFYSLIDSSGNVGLKIAYPGDPVFLAKLHNFLNAMAAKYDHIAEVLYVVITGIGNHAEWNTATGTKDTANLANTVAKCQTWQTAAKTIIDYHAAAFTNTPLCGALAKPFAASAAVNPVTMMRAVSDYAVAAYGVRFQYAFNGLNQNSNTGYEPANQIYLHWQTNPTGAQFGPVGALPYSDVDGALKAAEGLECRYVETYPQNLTNAAYASMLTSHNNILKAIPLPAPSNTRNISLSGNTAFGQVNVGSTSQHTLTISNLGNNTLTVTGISYPSGFSGTYSGTIAAGASHDVAVTFTPTSPASYAGTITVNSDKTTGTNTVAASGTGVALTRVVGLSGNVTFGTIDVNTTAQRTLTISNTGNSDLHVTSVTLPAGFSGSYSGTITAGQSHGVTITFSPTASQAYSGNITINSDKTSGANTIAVSGTGATRVIAVSGDLSFGNVTVGTTGQRTMSITNSGNVSLIVNGISCPSGFNASISSTVIAPGAMQNVTITFAPSAVQSYSGTIAVNSDKTSGASTLAASGTGIAVATPTKIISLSGNLSFGNVVVGTTAMQNLTIANSGTADLTITSISLPSGFRGSYAGIVPAGASVGVAITFVPTAAQLYSGTASVSGDQTSGTNTAAVSGTGLTKVIALSGTLAFGDVTIGTASQLPLAIANQGITTLTVSGVMCPSGFSASLTSTTIAPTSSVTATITFAPAAAQSYSGTITVASDATSGTNTVLASGSGIAVVSGTKVISLSGYLNFANIPVGQSATRTFTITNKGSEPLTVTSVIPPTAFSGNFSGSIDPGASQSVDITFTPTSGSGYSGNAAVQSDATSGSNLIFVAGVGISRSISVTGNLAFPTVNVGRTVTRRVTVTNTGNFDLTVSAVNCPTGFTSDFPPNGIIIIPLASRTINVQFAPTNAIAYSGTVTVVSDATSGPNTLSCSGTGRARDLHGCMGPFAYIWIVAESIRQIFS